MLRRVRESSAKPRATSISTGNDPRPSARLLRVKGVDRVRRKNADAENPDQYGYKLNHNTHPQAQPALN
jgi:hypothetical protein